MTTPGSASWLGWWSGPTPPACAASSPPPWPATAPLSKSSPTRQGVHRPPRPPPGRGVVRPHLPRTRDHPPAYRGPLPDHHRQDRTVPQDPAGRAADRPPLRLARRCPAGGGCLGGRLNTQRPHQAIAMAVPARRFQAPTAESAPAPAVQARQPLTVGPTEVTRRVSASGLIGICYQQVSAGRHLAGQVVTVRLHPSVLVFFAGQLIRTVPRRSTKEVVQLRAHRPHQPKPRPTTTKGSVNHHPEPNRKPSTGPRQQAVLRAPNASASQ